MFVMLFILSVDTRAVYIQQSDDSSRLDWLFAI